MSVASTDEADARGPSASVSVIAMEYGSSPVEAAQHQTDSGPRFLAKSARIGKWCDSRKNAVRLVVSALMKSSHSAASGSFSSWSR
ncbi:hypothetical protein D3C85_1723050 [compost metagenome]